MTQRPATSLLEVCLNVGSGYLLSMLIWQFVVAPVWGLDVRIRDNACITGVFTLVSILRGYVWRRAFNKERK